jgi:hypothetical protein
MTRSMAPALLAAMLVGCMPAQRETPPTAPDTGDPAPSPPTQAAQDVPMPDALPPQSPEESAADPGRRAEVGVGQRGRSLDDQTGIGRRIAQPAVSLFAFRERAVFEIQIPQAMQLFEATEGRKPTSHDEFMTRIIRENQIQLPELPEGSEYRYRPQEGELWVEPVDAG